MPVGKNLIYTNYNMPEPKSSIGTLMIHDWETMNPCVCGTADFTYPPTPDALQDDRGRRPPKNAQKRAFDPN